MSSPVGKQKHELFNSLPDSKQRRLMLIQSGHLSDCEFLVGDRNQSGITQEVHKNELEIRSFKCHKMVLATASEVFERLFYGEEFAERHNKEPIHVDDVTPEIFEILITFIYTYEFMADCLTVQRCQKLFYVGYKYMIEDFLEACVGALKERTSMIEDVLPLYELACFYNNLSLMSVSYEKIHTFAIQLLNHQTFFDLDVHNLKRLMVLLSKTIQGERLLQALERYARVNDIYCDKDIAQFKELVNAASCIHFGTFDQRPRSYLLCNI